MGSYISSCHCAGKVVLPDGGVQELDRPVAVAELMLEHPRNCVVEFRPSSTARLPPLPADYKLDPKRVYLMVPMARGKANNGVSVEEARRILMAAPSMVIQPMKIPLVGMCIVGASGKRKEVMAGGQKGDQSRRGRTSQVEETEISMEEFDEKAEFLCRQYSSKGWKPSLGTIQERNFEKVPHWLF